MSSSIASALFVAAIFLSISLTSFKHKKKQNEGAEKFTTDDVSLPISEDKQDNANEFIIDKCQNLKYWTKRFEHRPFPLARDRVFLQLDFDFVNGSKTDDWDILWSDDYPWNLLRNKTLLKHQKVHHFPGIHALMSKNDLSFLNRGEKFILPAFELPIDQKEFETFIKENPHKKIVEKGMIDHSISIIDVEHLEPKEDYLYQEFLDKPFLIDGFAFDFLVFVLITSFDPIRAYRFTEDVTLRFCLEKYHPFNPRMVNKFAIYNGNEETPSFTKLRKKFKHTTKNLFENLITKQGFGVSKFWDRVDAAIGKTLIKAEGTVMKNIKQENHSMQHFFALARFDFIFDEDLNPYIIEVNKSPWTMNEQVVLNSLRMIGASSYLEFYSRFPESEAVVLKHRNLATSINFCNQPKCLSCSETFCKICGPCMTPEVHYQLSEAFREHQNSANFKRVFPTKNHFDDEKLIAKMTENNQIQMKWFKGKCEEDVRWC